MNFPMFSCSHLSKFLSDPIRKQCALSKRVQESNLKEGSAVAKPKSMNLNLSSMRKIPSQEVRDPNSLGNQSLDQSGVPARSWNQSAWATDDGPTMYSQERQQNDAQTSNTRKQGRRNESSAQPAAGNSLRKGEVHPFGRRTPEFHTMQISDSGYLEKVLKNMKKKVNLAEDAQPLGIQAHKTNILIW